MLAEGARFVSPRSAQMSTVTARPKTKVKAKIDCQPKSSSRTPPSIGTTIGMSAMPMVT